MGWDKLRRQRYDRMVKMRLIDKKWALSPLDVPKWETYDEKMRDELDFKMALYSAIIDRMDQNVGRIVDKLKAAGRLDNTLILFLVDNGVPGTGVHDWRGLFAKNDRNPETRVDNYEEWGRLGGWTSSSGRGWANLSNAPFRMYKRYTHEGGVATPSSRIGRPASRPRASCAMPPATSSTSRQPVSRQPVFRSGNGRQEPLARICQGFQDGPYSLLGTRGQPGRPQGRL